MHGPQSYDWTPLAPVYRQRYQVDEAILTPALVRFSVPGDDVHHHRRRQLSTQTLAVKSTHPPAAAENSAQRHGSNIAAYRWRLVVGIFCGVSSGWPRTRPTSAMLAPGRCPGGSAVASPLQGDDIVRAIRGLLLSPTRTLMSQPSSDRSPGRVCGSCRQRRRASAWTVSVVWHRMARRPGCRARLDRGRLRGRFPAGAADLSSFSDTTAPRCR